MDALLEHAIREVVVEVEAQSAARAHMGAAPPEAALLEAAAPAPSPRAAVVIGVAPAAHMAASTLMPRPPAAQAWFAPSSSPSASRSGSTSPAGSTGSVGSVHSAASSGDGSASLGTSAGAVADAILSSLLADTLTPYSAAGGAGVRAVAIPPPAHALSLASPTRGAIVVAKPTSLSSPSVSPSAGGFGATGPGSHAASGQHSGAPVVPNGHAVGAGGAASAIGGSSSPRSTGSSAYARDDVFPGTSPSSLLHHAATSPGHGVGGSGVGSSPGASGGFFLHQQQLTLAPSPMAPSLDHRRSPTSGALEAEASSTPTAGLLPLAHSASSHSPLGSFSGRGSPQRPAAHARRLSPPPPSEPHSVSGGGGGDGGALEVSLALGATTEETGMLLRQAATAPPGLLAAARAGPAAAASDSDDDLYRFDSTPLPQALASAPEPLSSMALLGGTLRAGSSMSAAITAAAGQSPAQPVGDAAEQQLGSTHSSAPPSDGGARQWRYVLPPWSPPPPSALWAAAMRAYLEELVAAAESVVEDGAVDTVATLAATAGLPLHERAAFDGLMRALASPGSLLALAPDPGYVQFVGDAVAHVASGFSGADDDDGGAAHAQRLEATAALTRRLALAQQQSAREGGDDAVAQQQPQPQGGGGGACAPLTLELYLALERRREQESDESGAASPEALEALQIRHKLAFDAVADAMAAFVAAHRQSYAHLDALRHARIAGGAAVAAAAALPSLLPPTQEELSLVAHLNAAAHRAAARAVLPHAGGSDWELLYGEQHAEGAAACARVDALARSDARRALRRQQVPQQQQQQQQLEGGGAAVPAATNAVSHVVDDGPMVTDDATIAAVTEQLASRLLADVASELAA